MKTYLTLVATALAVFSAHSAHAFFNCFSSDLSKEAGKSKYFISVYEPTQDRPYSVIVLTDTSRPNVPYSFSCETGSFTNNSVIHTEYQCENGLGGNLSVYTSKKGTQFLANLYSEKLNLELNQMRCE